MFILRPAKIGDLDQVYELSLLMNFINLPRERETLEKKIYNSEKSFLNAHQDLSKNQFLFVLEDLSSKKVIGISIIHGKHGTEDEPHFFLKVDQENKYSKSLNTGFIHGTLKLGHETNGYTEIGGLVLDGAYRGHKLKLGKALSFIRFLYIGLNKHLFTENLHVELMPPFDKNGRSPLWEAIGRKFLNMEYLDADILSRGNKEFILSLFPRDTIYETLLPIEARDAIGKVGKETLPVKRMLEEIGFQYTNQVDPFDGGPHFRASVSNIKCIKNLKEFKLSFSDTLAEDLYLLRPFPLDDNSSFTVYLCPAKLNNDILEIGREFKSIFPNQTAVGFNY